MWSGVHILWPYSIYHNLRYFLSMGNLYSLTLFMLLQNNPRLFRLNPLSYGRYKTPRGDISHQNWTQRDSLMSHYSTFHLVVDHIYWTSPLSRTARYFFLLQAWDIYKTWRQKKRFIHDMHLPFSNSSLFHKGLPHPLVYILTCSNSANCIHTSETHRDENIDFSGEIHRYM